MLVVLIFSPPFVTDDVIPDVSEEGNESEDRKFFQNIGSTARLHICIYFRVAGISYSL